MNSSNIPIYRGIICTMGIVLSYLRGALLHFQFLSVLIIIVCTTLNSYTILKYNLVQLYNIIK